MKTTPKPILAILIIATAALPAAAIQINFSVPPQTGGNKGTSWRPAGANFVVTARWGLSDADNTGVGSYDPGQNPGTGYYDAGGNPLTSPTPRSR